MFGAASKQMNLDRMFMLLREGEESDELTELACQEACRAGRIKELMDIAWYQGNTFMLSRACWEWVITATENLQTKGGQTNYWVEKILGSETDTKFVEMAQWIVWLCYWSAIDCHCFILAACASQYQNPFVTAGSAYWLVWHIETNPDFAISSRYKDLVKECVEKGYLDPITKGTFNTYEAGDVLPPNIPPPQMPDVKIEGSCDNCNGDGKTNKKECWRCRGTGSEDKVVECSDCDGEGSNPRDDATPIIGGLFSTPCATCEHTGFVLKEDLP